MKVYHECDELRMQMDAMEAEYERRIEELEKALAERDRKIAQLQVQHRKQFKPNRSGSSGTGEPINVKVKRRGATPPGGGASRTISIGWSRSPPPQPVPTASARTCRRTPIFTSTFRKTSSWSRARWSSASCTLRPSARNAAGRSTRPRTGSCPAAA